MLERSPGRQPMNYTHRAFSPAGPSLPRPSLSDMSLNRTSMEHYVPSRGPVRAVGGAGRQRRVSADHSLQPRPVQHMAIAQSDIIGRTPDGRLIVQMPAVGVGSQHRQPSGQRPLHSSSSTGALQLSAATLPSGQPHPHSGQPHLHSGQPHPHSGQPQSNQLHSGQPHPHSGQLQPAAAASRLPASRPLPPTPLDIAMPQSQALRRSQSGHKPQAISMGNGVLHITPATLPSSPPHIPTTTFPSSPRVFSSPPHIPTTTLPSSPPHTATHIHPPPSPGTAALVQPMASQPHTSPSPSSQPSQSTPTPHRRGSGDYDTLSPSTATVMQQVTEQMSRALEQFDSVLPPEGIGHTSL